MRAISSALLLAAAAFFSNACKQWLNARLLQRTTRRVSLTDAGEHCLRRSRQMLALMQDIEEETAASQDGELRGQLRLTCSTSFVHAQLASALVAFPARHPQLKVDLNVSEGALNLVEARIDLAIRISSEPDPMLIARPLALCDSVLVASPAYLATQGRPQMPEDLGAHRCLSHANFGKSIWQLAQGDQSVQVSVASHFSANDAASLLQASLAGGGIALQPTYLANPHLTSGALLDFLVERFKTVPW